MPKKTLTTFKDVGTDFVLLSYRCDDPNVWRIATHSPDRKWLATLAEEMSGICNVDFVIVKRA